MNTISEQYHLIIARNDDTFLLTQIDHSGNDASIALNLSQVCHLAGVAGVIGSEQSATLPKGLQRRIRKLRDSAINLLEMLASVPCCPTQEIVSDDVNAAGNLVGLIDDLINDYMHEELDLNTKQAASRQNQ